MVLNTARDTTGGIKGMLKKLASPRPRLKYYYGHYYRFAPVRPKTILFESFHGQTISDSPLFLLRELIRSGQANGFTIYFSTAKPAEHQRFVSDQGLPVELVDVNSKKYTCLLATCEYLVNNSSFPSFFIRRESQRYIQTWHGTPLKTLGKRMRLGIESMHNVQHNFLQASHLLFPNEYTQQVLMRDYNLQDLFTGQSALCGYPRNTVFFDDAVRQQLRTKYGLDSLECLAYMPTWRGTSNHDIQIDSYAADLLDILQILDSLLKPKQRLYVNLHPLVASSITLTSFDHILPFPQEEDTYDFLSAMDGLITDYSSVFFDYSVTHRPIILFPYDLETYLAERDLYFRPDELPFPCVYSARELGELIAGKTYTEYGYSSSSYEQAFLQYESARNCTEALSFLFGREDCSLKITNHGANAQRQWQVVRAKDQSTTEQIDKICKQINPLKQIAVFNRYAFDQEKSAFLHDNYRDSFNFIFASNALPRTIPEELLKRVSKKTARRLADRDMKRLFGNLPVTKAAEPSSSEGTPATCMLKSIRRGNRNELRMVLRCKSADTPCGMVLTYRSKTEQLEHELPFTVRQRGESTLVKVCIDTGNIPLKEIYWDIYLLTCNEEGVQERHPIFVSKANAGLLALRNVQANCERGTIFFPYVSSGYRLTFTFRSEYPTDTLRYKVKELTAVGAYFLLRPYLRRKRIWLVFEKFCSTAQDNGYYFFKYCMEQPRSVGGHVYYVIDESSPDAANLSPYASNVIKRFSFKHILYSLAAGIYVASDCKSHVYVWRPKPNLVNALTKGRKIFFLQHGVTALKRVDPVFGKHGTNPMTYFLTTSSAEQKIVVDHFGYSAPEAPVLGFSRWDVLEDRSDNQRPKILVMPTWRPWLEGQSTELFMDSEYYKFYSGLIQNARLQQLLQEHNASLKFFIHPKLSELIEAFASTNPSCEIIKQGSMQLNELLMESSLLVTDYSSVCWDMLYMRKPVVFSMFDAKLYEQTVGSYIDFQSELPGPICENVDSLVEQLDAYLKCGMHIRPGDLKKSERWFTSCDSKNRERTFNFLEDEGF